MSQKNSVKRSLQKTPKVEEPEEIPEEDSDEWDEEVSVDSEVNENGNDEAEDDNGQIDEDNEEAEENVEEDNDGADIDIDDPNDLGPDQFAIIKNQTKEEKLQKIKEFNEKQAKKGVIYLSRIPPYMKASQVRKYFMQYGVLRIYLAPEEEGKRKYRAKHGGQRRRCYTEGWIEFADKKMAKFVAMTFNNQKIGGKKGSYYAEDIWNLKYLPKFKWENLTEKINYDQKMRKEKLKAELALAKKSHDFYLEQAEKSKKIMAIKNIKDQKRKALEDIETVLADAHAVEKPTKEQKSQPSAEDDKDRVRRMFKQKKPKKNTDE